MIPFPQSNVPLLMPIFEAMVREAKLEGRSDAQHCMAKLYEGYAGRNMDVYVDDVEDPKRVIIFGTFPGIVTKEKLLVVLFIYATPELRGEVETHAMFEKKIKEHLAFLGCDCVLASDWQLDGCQLGAGALYRKMGMKRQETTYVFMNPLKNPSPALPQ